jgi:hypothetical protein
MKLTKDDDYSCYFYWVGSPAAENMSEEMKVLSDRRFEIEIHGGVSDESLSYAYDEMALCELDGQFYLLSTSGCSCPSPSETWDIDIGPTTLEKIKEHILNGDYQGYTLPEAEQKELLSLIDSVISKNKK